MFALPIDAKRTVAKRAAESFQIRLVRGSNSHGLTFYPAKRYTFSFLGPDDLKRKIKCKSFFIKTIKVSGLAACYKQTTSPNHQRRPRSNGSCTARISTS